MNIINVSEDLPGFIARLTSFTSNLHHLMREFVQSLKNRIIFKIYGQFNCGIAHFQKEKDKSKFVKVHYGQIFKRNKNVRLFQRKHTAVNSGKKMETYK